MSSNRGVDIDSLHRARRPTRHLALRGADHDRRFAIALGQAPSHDAHDPGIPGRISNHDRGACQQLGLILQKLQCPPHRLLRDQPTLRIQRLEALGDRTRAHDVFSDEQFHAIRDVDVAPHPAQCVQARCQPKADVVLLQLGSVEPRQLDQCLQSDPRRPTQHIHTTLQQVAHIVSHHRHVSDNAQCNEIEQMLCISSHPLIEGTDDLVGNTNPRQLVERMCWRQPFGVHHGKGRRKGSGQIVVIGDQQVDAPTQRSASRLMPIDACICGQQHGRARIDQLLHASLVQPVRFPA